MSIALRLPYYRSINGPLLTCTVRSIRSTRKSHSLYWRWVSTNSWIDVHEPVEQSKCMYDVQYLPKDIPKSLFCAVDCVLNVQCLCFPVLHSVKASIRCTQWLPCTVIIVLIHEYSSTYIVRTYKLWCHILHHLLYNYAALLRQLFVIETEKNSRDFQQYRYISLCLA